MYTQRSRDIYISLIFTCSNSTCRQLYSNKGVQLIACAVRISQTLCVCVCVSLDLCVCERERGRGERKREHTCLFCESDAYVNLHFYVHIYIYEETGCIQRRACGLCFFFILECI